MSAAGFEWEAFLKLAEELIGRRGDLAAERSATSRAYYAACHLARDYASGLGGRLAFTAEEHVLVWDWFLGAGAEQGLQRIGNDGHWLRRARRRADYDAMPVRDPATEARSAVRLARRIVTDLERAG